MDILNKSITKIVCISEKAREYVTVAESDAYRIAVNRDPTQALTGEIARTIRDDGASSIHAVVMIHVSEYPRVWDFLADHAFVVISYRYVLFGTEEEMGNFKLNYIHNISEFRMSSISATEFAFIVRKTFLLLEEMYVDKYMQENYLARLIDTKEDQDDLINIGRALSIEKDQDKLLRLILTLSKRITGADAGSIYLVEEGDNGGKRLRFKYSHTFSREIPLEEFTLEMNKKSIAGYVAVTGEVLNIPDAYNLPEDAPYSYNTSFDLQNNYHCTSMLVVPMKNHVDEIIGVIQLINSKEDLSRNGREDPAFSIVLDAKEDFDRYVVPFK